MLDDTVPALWLWLSLCVAALAVYARVLLVRLDAAKAHADVMEAVADRRLRRVLDMTEQNRRRGVYTAAADDCPDCGAPFRVESCGRRCDRCGYLLMRGK